VSAQEIGVQKRWFFVTKTWLGDVVWGKSWYRIPAIRKVVVV